MLSKQGIVYFVGRCFSQVCGCVLNMNSRGPNMLSAQKSGLKLEVRCKALLKMGKAMLCSVWRVVWRCHGFVTFCTVVFNYLGDELFFFLIQNMVGERKGTFYLLLITSHLCSPLLALLKPSIRVIPVVHFAHPPLIMNSESRME